MKKLACILGIAAILGCASDPGVDIPDSFCDLGDYQNCDFSRDAGDCVLDTDCGHPVGEEDVYLGDFTANAALRDEAGNPQKKGHKDGYVGEIASDCDDSKQRSSSGDGDFIEVHSDWGAPIQITVERVVGGAIHPVVYLYDRAGRQIVFSGNPKATTAEFFLRAPSDTFYLYVREYENTVKAVCPDGSPNGGKEYRYQLNIRDAKVKVTDLGDIQSTQTSDYKFTRRGDGHYFELKSGSSGIKVSLNGKGKLVMSPLAYHTSTPDGWVWAGTDLKPDSEHQESGVIPSEYASCDGQVCTYGFVVTDYDGETEGISYTLSVEPL